MLVSVCIICGKKVDFAARSLDILSPWCSCTKQGCCKANSDMGDTQVKLKSHPKNNRCLLPLLSKCIQHEAQASANRQSLCHEGLFMGFRPQVRLFEESHVQYVLMLHLC